MKRFMKTVYIMVLGWNIVNVPGYMLAAVHYLHNNEVRKSSAWLLATNTT